MLVAHITRAWYSISNAGRTKLQVVWTTPQLEYSSEKDLDSLEILLWRINSSLFQAEVMIYQLKKYWTVLAHYNLLVPYRIVVGSDVWPHLGGYGHFVSDDFSNWYAELQAEPHAIFCDTMTIFTKLTSLQQSVYRHISVSWKVTTTCTFPKLDIYTAAIVHIDHANQTTQVLPWSQAHTNFSDEMSMGSLKTRMPDVGMMCSEPGPFWNELVKQALFSLSC